MRCWSAGERRQSRRAHPGAASARAGEGRQQRARGLQKLAENDQNQYIRSQARTMLAQMPEID